MQKTYCDVCKKEIKKSGKELDGKSGKIAFKLVVVKELSEETLTDVCLPCVVRAVNTVAHLNLKRKYTKKQAESEAS